MPTPMTHPVRRPSRRPARAGSCRSGASRARRGTAAGVTWLLLLPVLFAGVLAVATAGLTARDIATAPPAAAQNDDNGPNWLPFRNDPGIELWCTWSNPSPYNNCTSYHPTPALDIGMPPGTPIYASGKGVVAASGNNCVAGDTSCNGAQGNYVAIQHPNGLYSRYMHLTSEVVTNGATVERGQLIGYSGYTGSVYPTSPKGAHLHFDVVTSLISVQRVDPGPLRALQGGNVVLYPQVLGYSGWNAAPYGTTFNNEGYPEDEPPPPVPNGTPPASPGNGAAFHPVVPFRLLDSRDGTGGWTGPLRANLPWGQPLAVGGVGGIPATASAVVMNVTVTGATLPGYLTAFPWGAAPPTAANLVFLPGQTVPNLVTVSVGAGGAVAFFSSAGKVHVVADVVGYYDDGTGAGDLFHPTTPARVLDSRTDTGGWAGKALGQGEARDLTVAGVGEVPPDASAVVMNVTATGPSRGSYLQAYPTGATQPVTANLVFAAGETVPNLVVVGTGESGQVRLFNQLGDVHVVIDVVGWFDAAPGGSRFHPIGPTRMIDNRSGVGGYTGPWLADTWRAVGLGDGATVPAGATGVVVNVTATNASDPTFLALYPGGLPNPGTANVLVDRGETVPNLVMVGMGDGAVTVYNQLGAVDVVGDVAGYFTAG